MTIKEWCRLADTHHTHPTTERGMVSVICRPGDVNREALWHLADYWVAGVHGIVIWLAPRADYKPESDRAKAEVRADVEGGTQRLAPPRAEAQWEEWADVGGEA